MAMSVTTSVIQNLLGGHKDADEVLNRLEEIQGTNSFYQFDAGTIPGSRLDFSTAVGILLRLAGDDGISEAGRQLVAKILGERFEVTFGAYNGDIRSGARRMHFIGRWDYPAPKLPQVISPNAPTENEAVGSGGVGPAASGTLPSGTSTPSVPSGGVTGSTASKLASRRSTVTTRLQSGSRVSASMVFSGRVISSLRFSKAVVLSRAAGSVFVNSRSNMGPSRVTIRRP